VWKTGKRDPVPAVAVGPAVRADTDAAAAIWHEGWHDAHAPLTAADIVAGRTPAVFAAWFAAQLKSTYVATVDGVPAGFAMIDGDELDQFYVGRRWRGHGVALPLMRHAERIMAARGVGEAWLSCAVGNLPARRFYAKAGWIEGPLVDATIRGAPGRTLPCHRFTKALGR